ncbi:uncharacterized protein LACBIDRAFT_335027 [Laccaria bicolor S238N-H82]|uniref:Predicted protein n=1 Tax=Laccaria bicolor (strain S238N-H82 / ATCC MYA-4686) TaxID=486041 RepID=B0E147_LACBS|nr:uncharacterized protein LACBIDRAFT_335027 [Laccaria bicolor S238N-H82]EDQ99450.1 predicted protein [Laccaria bicolor S238N-H82]|eukprot:XP_001889905.1 predicted protein [Laccaria bicolor S238N-H82]
MAPMVLDEVDPAVVLVTALTCKAPNALLQPIRVAARVHVGSKAEITQRVIQVSSHSLPSVLPLFLFPSEFPALSPFWVAAARPWPLGEICLPRHRSVTLPDRLFRRSQPYL